MEAEEAYTKTKKRKRKYLIFFGHQKNKKIMSTVEKKESDQQQERMWSKRTALAWVSIAMLCVVGYFLWQLLQKKVEGKIRVKEPESVEALHENNEKKLYKGKFVEFFHGDEYIEKSHSTLESGPIVETIFLATPDVEGQKLAVTVAYRGNANFASDPAFQFRQVTLGDYRSKSIQEGIWQGVLFENDAAPFEKTVFLEKNGYIMSISLSSPFGSDDLEEEILAIIRGFSFSL